MAVFSSGATGSAEVGQAPASCFSQVALALLFLFVVLWLAPSMVQAQAPVESIESAKASKSLLLDIARAGDRLVAVGQRGHIIFSDDQGQSWLQAKVPSRQLLTAVYFVDAQHGWAVGHDAQVLASADAGATWAVQYEDPGREAPLLDVWFENLQHGIAVGAYGGLLETTDGGKNWEDIAYRLENEDEMHLNAITAVEGAGLMIAGEMGMLFRSRDNGQNWEGISTDYEGSFFGLQAVDAPNTLLVYGLRGTLYRSADFGDNWQKIQLQSADKGGFVFGLAGSTRMANANLVLVGHGGSVLLSDDQGQSFSVRSTADRQSLSSVSEINGQLVLVGQEGVQLMPVQAGQETALEEAGQ